MFLISFVYAGDCQVVWPQFGVVSCQVFYGSSPETMIEGPSSCSDNICHFSFSCAGKSECKISSYDIQLDCPGAPCLEYSIYKDGSLLGDSFGYGSCWGKDDPPPVIYDFNTLDIVGRCNYIVGQTEVDNSSTVKMTYRNKYLYDTTPDYPEHKVDESVGCVPNEIMYKSGIINKLPSSFVDSEGNTGSVPGNAIDSLPTNMDVGETYSYFYSWKEVPNINLVKNKEGSTAGYCGGSLGDRKLLDYSEISANGGCYTIPTSVQKNVECCYNEDCKWKGEEYVCDPTTFICSENKPCNSDIECQVIGQTTCSNNLETSWSCDLSKPWYPKEGTCTKFTKNVLCCSEKDCGVDEYCNKELGCQSTYTLENCPRGKCCVSGGSYKEKECNNDLECCTLSVSFVGICAEDCSKINQESLKTTASQSDSQQSSLSKSSTGTIILVIFLILIGGSIAYFIYVKKKKGKNKPSDKKIEKPKEKKGTEKGKHCTKCGNLLKSGSKFCTKCGKKVLK